MSISLRELAELAGVSRTAVSLVMNGKNRGNVSAQKTKLIRSLAREHGYRPSLTARSLRGCARKLIGILMPMPIDCSASKFCGLLQSKLHELGYMSLFSFWNGYGDVPECYETVLYHQADAIIAWQNPSPQLANGTRQVLYEIPENKSYDAVLLDRTTMIRQAMDQFLQAGKKRIAIIDPQQGVLCQEAERYLQQKNVAPLCPWYETWTLVSQNLRAEELQKPDFPDAIFVQNDGQAEALATFLRENKRRVPEDIMVIGCNNLLELPSPNPLPTFNINHEKIVDSLIELLFRRMQNPDAEIVQTLVQTDFISKSNATIYKIG